jgi:hypothetical protein
MRVLTVSGIFTAVQQPATATAAAGAAQKVQSTS